MSRVLGTIMLSALIAILSGAAQAGVVSIFYSENGPGTVNQDVPGGGSHVLHGAGFSRVDDVELDQGAGLLFWNNWIPGFPSAGPGEGIYKKALPAGVTTQILGGPYPTPTGFPSGLHGISLDTAVGDVYYTRGVSYANPVDPAGLGSWGEVARIDYTGAGYTQLTGDTTTPRKPGFPAASRWTRPRVPSTGGSRA